MYSRDLKKYLEGTFLKIFNMLESIQKETNIIAKTNRVDQNPLQRCLPIVKSTHFDCLPFESIEEILEFDLKVAIDDIFKSDFMIFVSQCGGHTKKENIIRVLKKVFGNKIAQECSWMGFRQNFRVGSLKLMDIIRDAINVNFPGTEKEFGEIASEWFRLAKQRYMREQKKETTQNPTI